MARNKITVPPITVPVLDENGRINQDWYRALEYALYVVSKMAEGIDEASGSASGSTVDDEWNAFVNKVRVS